MPRSLIKRMLDSLFGEAPRGRLPARVRSAIAREQAESEILIGWVQLAGVATFTALYSLAPKTFPPDAVIEPVPWALGIYFGVTVLRLTLAYRRALPEWFAGLSVAIDMAVLMITIWSFHIQYGQPAAFYLKAPTLLYVFILIALRTLRFDARFVVLAGAAAVAGWVALLGYAVSEGGPALITRDYVRYMTSSTILLGGEFDKIMSFAMVTAVLAVAVVRARRFLVRSLAESAAAEDLSRFFAPEVSRQITGAELQIRPGEGELRDAAVLYVDIRSFTPIAHAMAPGAVMRLLAEYQGRMAPIINRHGGVIDKFLGDGIMATFGAAHARSDYAAAAIGAADEIMAAADAWGQARKASGEIALRIGIGIAVGPVVFGAVGDQSRLEFTVIGDAVNLAAKLEKHTKAEGVRALATAETWAFARAQGYAGPARGARLDGRRMEGVDEPLDLVVLAA